MVSNLPEQERNLSEQDDKIREREMSLDGAEDDDVFDMQEGEEIVDEDEAAPHVKNVDGHRFFHHRCCC